MYIPSDLGLLVGTNTKKKIENFAYAPLMSSTFPILHLSK